jgi:hypothetical protein
MNKRVVEHEIKLEKSVKVILGVLALGVLLNAFAPVFSVSEALAQFPSSLDVYVSGAIGCSFGCN